MKRSSILQLNTCASLNARVREGLYFPFSIAEIVCLLMFNLFAIYCCVQLFSARNTFKRFFILITAIITIKRIAEVLQPQEKQVEMYLLQ